MSESTHIPAGRPSSYRAIENLIATYAELVDDGDFAGLGAMLADATFTGSGALVSGPDAIEKMFRDTLIVYDDGTPRTRHVTTNVAIEADEEAGTAVSRAQVGEAYSCLDAWQLRPGCGRQGEFLGPDLADGAAPGRRSGGTAVSRAYFTVLQAVPGLALQPIVSGRYRDRFERRDGQWRFAERRVLIDLVGDVSRHLRHPK